MEEKNMQSDEKQAAVPYFIHEGDMTRMDMAMEKLQKTSKDALDKMQENTKQMKSALLIVCVTLIVAVAIFVAGYSWNNSRWMEYTKALQAEGAGHGDQQTGIHELPDPELIRERIHSRRDRKILFLKLVDGLTFGEIAEETGIPISTITDAYYKQTKILFQDFPG